jgi:hypothetical protein
MKLEDPILEELVARAEADETGKLTQIMQELIDVSSRAAATGFELQELASVCTIGHFLGKNPEYLQAMEYLVMRGIDTGTEH